MLSLDQKGRLTVPARYKEVLMSTVQGRMVVSKCPDGCLALYPMPVY